MNPEWWLGKNMRTGSEGIFPVSYVRVQERAMGGFDGASDYPNPHYPQQKANAGGYPGQPQYQPQTMSQGPPAPGTSNPYNNAVPPMGVAEQPVDGKHGKESEMGKKFGKRLGNAAIFGAGATLGSDLVNAIL
jgi:hypothetical protein